MVVAGAVLVVGVAAAAVRWVVIVGVWVAEMERRDGRSSSSGGGGGGGGRRNDGVEPSDSRAAGPPTVRQLF
ncbi:hypothetical protein AXF42_Ash008204 [Apostasia shenzhenica]|uniref:Uncharacterized protein n=1 Tax=Apostasia shenzhenica TaxID=1088818 RepID=A0A2I0A8X7_9ASPA|nr:hypothetical protein AXF42_Ash008204 [Apostasia shenzhenica]